MVRETNEGMNEEEKSFCDVLRDVARRRTTKNNATTNLLQEQEEKKRKALLIAPHSRMSTLSIPTTKSFDLDMMSEGTSS